MATLIHIVDDDASFRTAVGRLLQTLGYSVAEYESASQFLACPPDGSVTSCILLDVKMPGLSGPELHERLADLDSVLPIIFLTGHGDIQTAVQAIKGGAEDVLTKPVSASNLLDAIGRAERRYQSARERHEQLQAVRTLLDRLTSREREVFELVIRGKMSKQIAHDLGITERTIKAHRQQIIEKLQVRSVAQLVSMAERLGTLS